MLKNSSSSGGSNSNNSSIYSGSNGINSSFVMVDSSPSSDIYRKSMASMAAALAPTFSTKENTAGHGPSYSTSYGPQYQVMNNNLGSLIGSKGGANNTQYNSTSLRNGSTHRRKAHSSNHSHHQRSRSAGIPVGASVVTSSSRFGLLPPVVSATATSGLSDGVIMGTVSESIQLRPVGPLGLFSMGFSDVNKSDTFAIDTGSGGPGGTGGSLGTGLNFRPGGFVVSGPSSHKVTPTAASSLLSRHIQSAPAVSRSLNLPPIFESSQTPSKVKASKIKG